MAGRSRVGSGQTVSGADLQVTGPRLAEEPSPAATEASSRRSKAPEVWLGPEGAFLQEAGRRVKGGAGGPADWTMRERGRGWGSTRTTGASEVLGGRAAPVCACVCARVPIFPERTRGPLFMGVGAYLPLMVRIP